MHYFHETDEDDTNELEPTETDPGEDHYKDPLIGEGSGEEENPVL